MRRQALYDRLPVFAQNLVSTAAGLKRRQERFNRRFWRTLDEWEALQAQTFEERQRFLWPRLRRAVGRARSHVPLYRTMGIPPPADHPDPTEAIQRTLRSIPILEKETVRRVSRFILEERPAGFDDIYACIVRETGRLCS